MRRKKELPKLNLNHQSKINEFRLRQAEENLKKAEDALSFYADSNNHGKPGQGVEKDKGQKAKDYFSGKK